MCLRFPVPIARRLRFLSVFCGVSHQPLLLSCCFSHAGSSDRCATVQKHGVLAMGLLQECIVFVSERRVMRLLNRDKNTIAASCYPSVQFVASGRRFRVASTHADAARRSLRCGFQNQQPNSLQQHGDHETNRTFSVTKDERQD